MCKTSRRLSWHPGWMHPAVGFAYVLPATLWSQWVSRMEQSTERASECAWFVCVHMLKRVCDWVCMDVSVSVCVCSCEVEHSGTSAAVTSLSCWERRVLSQPGNAWSQPKRSPLLSFPLFFLPYLFCLPSQSQMEVQLAAGLDWAWKHTNVQWPLTYLYHRAQMRTAYTFFMIPDHIFLWMPDKHPPSASLAASWNTRETQVRLKKKTEYQTARWEWLTSMKPRWKG